MIKRALPGLAVFILLSQNSAWADTSSSTLQGRIEQRNALQRVNRPAMPSRPLGEALEHAPSGTSTKHAGFDLAASSVSNLLDKNAFNFGLRSESGKPDNFPSANTAQKAGVDASDKELVIEWEEWHKRLCATIYHFWLTYGNIPGDGVVTMKVNRDGDIDFDLDDFHVNPFEQFSPQQKELFDRSVGRTLQNLAHTDVLVFPPRSQRKDVSLTTKFTFTEQDSGEQGYTWKKGDYEKVLESH